MDTAGSNGNSSNGRAESSSDPLRTTENPTTPATVYVTIPQNSIAVSKGVQSVIQQPQQSVIQSTPLQTLQLAKNGVFLLKQPSNSVIQSPGGNNLQTLQIVNANSLEETETRKRPILSRRPSYKKILNDITGDKTEPGSSDSSQDESSLTATTGPTITVGGQHYHTAVIPASTLQLAQAEGLQGLTMTNTSSGGGAIVHYGTTNSDGQLIVPVAASDLGSLKIATSMGNGGQGVVLTTAGSGHQGNDNLVEEASRKREMRLYKNREAAKECRRKKKEYIICLENRVAVLDTQNKALIEELKALKELYCQKPE